MRFLWNWFVEVFNPGGVGFGPYRVPFSEIEAYASVTRQIILPREARLIRRLSEEYLKVYAEKQEKDMKSGGNTPSGFKSVQGNKNLRSMFMSKGKKPPGPIKARSRK